MNVLIFALLSACLLASVPIFMSLTIVAFVVFYFYTSMPLEILPQRMFAGVEGFALLAVPFFIFAANLMGKGGVTARLIKFANSLVGHLPGGLAICTVLTCAFFGAITGSSAASVVAVGGIMFPALLEAGYDSRFSLGIVTCSALLGMIVPPSNAMIIYGSISKVSVGALFISGIGAGFVFALVYSVYCYVYAKVKKIPMVPRAKFREVLSAGRGAVWGLGIPVIILGGIYAGVFTPTESAAVAVAYGLFVSRFVYKELSFRQIGDIALDSAIVTARILIMVAAATLFSWLLTVQGITQQMVKPIVDLQLSPWAVLAFSNICFLFAGMFVDVFSNILILGPLLLPLIGHAGISELHFGIVTTVNSDMGNVTPPFGLNIFIASGAFKKSYLEVVRAVLPWLALAILSLLIITYFPQISLWLPKMLYPGIN